MTEHNAGSDGHGPLEPTDGNLDSGRLAAHERLSTGALARWMRACATHPGRVFLAWGGIIVLLVVLVIGVGGGLKDEFSIPGSDTQRATDLIESEFAAEQGAVLNLVFAAPEGETLDTPERRAAIEDAIARLQSDEFAPTDDKAGIESVGDPFEDDTILRRWPDRLYRGAVQRDDRDRGPLGGRGGRGRRPRDGRARGHHRRVQR